MSTVTVPIITPRADIPPLASGDRLTRDEFERRYAAMPESTRAELVEGVVYVASPARHTHHGNPQALIVTWLGMYAAATPGIEVSDNATVRLDLDNEPQPDGLLMLDEARGGQCRLDADGYIEGAPELAVEVAASTASYDLHDKLNAYRRNGVLEYVVWRVLDGALDWFVLDHGRYLRAIADGGVFRSVTFPGLWLDARALLARDGARVLDCVREGTRSPEHAAFVRG